jgi:hypothetical protein
LKNYGDFSRWSRYRRGDNFNGVFYQQGRVLSDADGTTQTRLINEWQHVAGSDIIGSGVAAYPANEPHSFNIMSAKLVDVNQQKKIQVEVEPPEEVLEDVEDKVKGRAWADGIIVYLENEQDKITRTAAYLGPPFHNVPPTLSINSRDAVILEVSQGTISAFQLPDQLLEPALGGPETTEILHTSYSFKLLRLEQEEEDDCFTIREKLKEKLKDDFSKRGRLTVSLQPPSDVVGECPVDENFGYTGITHNLYRIEIADVNSGLPKFKWSQFNGGLVGRGRYTDDFRSKIMITHNLQAINCSGLTDLYLEIVTYDKDAGYWKVAYGIAATLNTVEKELKFSGSPIFGKDPPDPTDDTDGIFFRLWNGIRDISEFTSDPPNPLIDGIYLKFDNPISPSSIYHPQDYWMFEVRAGAFENDEKLIDNSLPQGIHYHRVPLAIINWDTDNTASRKNDCRLRFSPLSVQKTGDAGCCTIRVGDGVTSHGENDNLQSAIESIAKRGEICLLAGVHKANVVVDEKSNLVIRGCGNNVKIIQEHDNSPIISIINSDNILVQGIEFEAPNTGAILLNETKPKKLHDIEIDNNKIQSFKNAVQVNGGVRVNVHNNNITMPDHATGTGIYIKGGEILVEKNRISVESPADYQTPGGIQIGGGSEGVKILSNKILGGSANGITLGGDGNFIYEVSIDSNDISEMGLSGIGMPRLVLPEEAEEVPTVVGLQVCRNHIVNCLQKPFDESMSKEAKLPSGAFGGIVLRSCEEVYILENTIEQNGTRHIDPVCGIFIHFASGVQIIQNRIFDNGPLKKELIDERLDAGNRGGVVLPNVFGKINPIPSDISAYDRHGHRAARIHDNVVSQPAGFGLLIGSLGTVSVINNYFNSELAYISTEEPNRFGGCVSITNALAGTSVIFNNNQTVLGPRNESIVCQRLDCKGDLAFGFNHSSCLSSGDHMNLLTNTFLHGKTVRASDNRFELFAGGASGFSLECTVDDKFLIRDNQCDRLIKVNGIPLPALPPALPTDLESVENRKKLLEYLRVMVDYLRVMVDNQEKLRP